MVSARSSSSARASASQRLGAICMKSNSGSSSCSSSISPTISSTRSSIVTKPSVPEYSSRTIARWVRVRRISSSSASTLIFCGTKRGWRMKDSRLSGRFCPEARTANTSLMWIMPITLSSVSRYTGNRLWPCSAKTAMQSAKPALSSIATMSLRGTMTSSTRCSLKCSKLRNIVRSTAVKSPSLSD